MNTGHAKTRTEALPAAPAAANAERAANDNIEFKESQREADADAALPRAANLSRSTPRRK